MVGGIGLRRVKKKKEREEWDDEPGRQQALKLYRTMLCIFRPRLLVELIVVGYRGIQKKITPGSNGPLGAVSELGCCISGQGTTWQMAEQG
jgi:hypothetical protein